MCTVLFTVLFPSQGVDVSAYQPSCNPSFGEGSEDMFVFVGRFIGLSLLHQQLLSVRFPRVFYCMLVGQPFTLQVCTNALDAPLLLPPHWPFVAHTHTHTHTHTVSFRT
jgi:hypothetical protein